MSGLAISIDQDILSHVLIDTQIGAEMAVTLQRVLFHEMVHIALGHIKVTYANEMQTIGFTNEFIAEYYGEAARVLEHLAYYTDTVQDIIATLDTSAVFGAVGTLATANAGGASTEGASNGGVDSNGEDGGFALSLLDLDFNRININSQTGSVTGSVGDDLIIGSDEGNTAEMSPRLFCNDGHDYIAGGNRNDCLSRGNGNDTLLGGAGADVLSGKHHLIHQL